jgi:hypothetical protein
MHTGKVDAGTPQPTEISRQQRREQLEQLADIFVCIFSELSTEQRANISLAFKREVA